MKEDIEVKKTRSMQEVLEEEMKRVRVKENALKMCEMVKNGEAEKISKEVYPLFDPLKAGKVGGDNLNGNGGREEEVVGKATVRKVGNSREGLGAEGQKTMDLKKKGKPAWLKTEAQQEEEEVDDLLNFMDSFDANKYAEDVQIREMLATLKNRVVELKGEDNWKEKWEVRLKEKRKKREEEYIKEKEAKLPDDDMIPMNGDNASQIGIGGNSVGSRGEARTVISERTQGRTG